MSQPNDGQDRIDYRETADITEVHAAIAREHAEPRTGTMPIPIWLGALSAGALCWAGAYVGMFSGGFSSSIYNEYQSSPAAFFPLPAVGGPNGQVEELPLFQLGEKVYAKNCAVCHSPTGVGQPGAVPPLAGSEWVDGSEASEKRLIAILLKGITGPLTVKGVAYNSAAMQGFGAQMKPRELAGVLTYIRQAWGNKGGEVTETQVVAAKKLLADKVGAYTEPEIKTIPVTDKIEGGAPAGDGKPVVAAAASDSKPTAEAKPASSSSAGSYDLVASIANGQKIYATSCGTCHQPTGAGIPGAFPALIGTEWVLQNPRRLTAIVLKGITGPMTVNGQVYATGMPNPETMFPAMKDDKNVADVLNYVRNTWGNRAEPVITPEFVGKVRDEFKAKTDQWTEADLKNFPETK
jgi:mono/diheme cytochrome c family protein